MRVALVHYWLGTWRGGEQVLRAIADLYPQADIYTHVADPDLVRKSFAGHVVKTTFISRLPLARRLYQAYLPLMPIALENLDLRKYDLVISSEAGPAKGVIVAPDATHICYCHSPMRYAWDMYHDYRATASRPTRMLMSPILHYMRMWDQLSAQRVDYFVANSRFVAKRIRKCYRRDSTVIYPPVDVAEFGLSEVQSDRFLSVGQLVPYKRPDLLVDAFNELGLPLEIIGEGPMLRTLRKRARPNIRFLGRQPFNVIRQRYAECRALVFPGVEDFGMVPVEAMASGRPVIAYARGGALETVVDRVTGLLFHEQSAASLVEAVRAFESVQHSFDPSRLVAHAACFSVARFKSEFSAYVKAKMRDCSQDQVPP